jgi:signal transduction histidine kinase
MARSLHRGLNERRLRWWLCGFFVAVAVPVALLVLRANAQMKWEVFHQWRVSAEELSGRIDARLTELLAIEEARSFADYTFLTVTGDPGATYLQRSPLSAFPVASDIPGLVGYFQVDRSGALSSPIVPERGTPYADYGVSDGEYRERLAVHERLGAILGAVDGDRAERRLSRMRTEIVPGAADSGGATRARKRASADVAGAGAPADASANVFDRLSQSLGSVSRRIAPAAPYARVDELELDERREQKSRQQRSVAELAAAPQAPRRETRKEQVASYDVTAPSALAESAAPAAPVVAESAFDAFADADESLAAAEPAGERAAVGSSATAVTPPGTPRVRFFDGEIDPFTFAELDRGHFVMFRNVWREGERFIQGAVIERAAFIDALITNPYRGTALAAMSRLLVAYDDNVIGGTDLSSAGPAAAKAGDLRGELLYRTRLSAPFAAIELLYTVTQLPAGAGARYLAWVGLVLALVLVGGCFVIYRYGIAQLSLFRQQQDFVSAVSHELKTPLTSIRMYSEILQAGWADEDKKARYYTFIHDESERLSRLIANVLQLSRMTRGNHTLEMKTLTARELLDIARSKISSQVEAAGFTLHCECDEAALAQSLSADPDAFTQIMINLVDNAIKFCPADARRQIDITCRYERGAAVAFAVRDYGRGIAKNQLRKIFELFYRPESELTRETVGTGIGLALVRQLTDSMRGRIDVHNRDPGVEFVLSFAVVSAGETAAKAAL